MIEWIDVMTHSSVPRCRAQFVIKIAVLGPNGYFGDKFNNLDFALVIFGILDLILEAVLGGTKALRVLRIFRLARVLRILSLAKITKITNPTPTIDLLRIVEVISDAGFFISSCFFLLLFFTFIFALAGMQVSSRAAELGPISVTEKKLLMINSMSKIN